MTHFTPLARGSKDPKKFVNFLLTQVGVPKDQDIVAICRQRREG